MGVLLSLVYSPPLWSLSWCRIASTFRLCDRLASTVHRSNPPPHGYASSVSSLAASELYKYRQLSQLVLRQCCLPSWPHPNAVLSKQIRHQRSYFLTDHHQPHRCPAFCRSRLLPVVAAFVFSLTPFSTDSIAFSSSSPLISGLIFMS
ncbi:hypothetical protein PIB30_087951 [Stylosanthes scabra]|uniref:Secreted protein n=1 Tax=Stylosanthes scabra TaxID=79078 RepID=A0ABU6USY5_9FABA|nr:hypothetical protein [Stylosanthes scabra]